MTKRQEKAKEYFVRGYNCAQSVAVAFNDIMNKTNEEVLSLTAVFGAGFSRSRNICGAISAIGMVYGDIIFKETNDKSKVYEEVNKLMEAFKAKNETVICLDLLKGIKIKNSGTTADERTEEYYKVRPCLKFVLDAVEILEEALIKREKSI